PIWLIWVGARCPAASGAAMLVPSHRPGDLPKETNCVGPHHSVATPGGVAPVERLQDFAALLGRFHPAAFVLLHAVPSGGRRRGAGSERLVQARLQELGSLAGNHA